MAKRAEARKIGWGIEDVATHIGQHVDAWRVVLFGSQARGDAGRDSDYDLYVEVRVSCESMAAVEDQIWNLLSRRGDLPVDVHVHPPGEIERRADDPGAIEWDVAREGILLYTHPGAPRLSVPSDRVSEPSQPPPASPGEWLVAAERDMQAAALLLERSNLWPEVCYHVQQTCEKQLKALLASRGVRPPRSHRLELLLARLRGIGCELPGLREDWSRLSNYAITGRCPGRQIGEAEAQDAVRAAERVLVAVKSAMSHPGDE